MGRLIVDVSTEQHQLIKALAATEGKTIKDYVLERLLPDSDVDAAWDELKALLQKRLQKADAIGPSSKSLTDIMEAKLQDLA